MEKDDIKLLFMRNREIYRDRYDMPECDVNGNVRGTPSAEDLESMDQKEIRKYTARCGRSSGGWVLTECKNCMSCCYGRELVMRKWPEIRKNSKDIEKKMKSRLVIKKTEDEEAEENEDPAVAALMAAITGNKKEGCPPEKKIRSNEKIEHDLPEACEEICPVPEKKQHKSIEMNHDGNPGRKKDEKVEEAKKWAESKAKEKKEKKGTQKRSKKVNETKQSDRKTDLAELSLCMRNTDMYRRAIDTLKIGEAAIFRIGEKEYEESDLRELIEKRDYWMRSAKEISKRLNIPYGREHRSKIKMQGVREFHKKNKDFTHYSPEQKKKFGEDRYWKAYNSGDFVGYCIEEYGMSISSAKSFRSEGAKKYDPEHYVNREEYIKTSHEKLKTNFISIMSRPDPVQYMIETYGIDRRRALQRINLYYKKLVKYGYGDEIPKPLTGSRYHPIDYTRREESEKGGNV